MRRASTAARASIARSQSELAADLDELRCACIHEDDIELRFRAGTSPDVAVDIGARAVIDAWRAIATDATGAYR